MAKRRLTINHKLFSEAKEYLVGGVNSPVRSFNQIGTEPILIQKGRGAYIWDYDGNKYIDYCLSWGALILGHAHPLVIKGLKAGIGDGLSFGATNEQEIELAKIIRCAIPFIEKIRFANSGTEAVMGAIRLARGYTKRDKIIRFGGSYHGHADYLLTESAGIPKDFLRHTLTAPYGNAEAVRGIFKRHGSKIAAILVEPVAGNFGVIRPDNNFLYALRESADKYGSVLIFDEVITGFRFGFGSAANEFGVIPDLVCLGKIIGAGLPIGAFGGKREIMAKLAPLGNVYQAGTFSGNPVVMRAGITALKELYRIRHDYCRIRDLAKYLKVTIENEAARRNIDLEIPYYGTMFSVKFKDPGKFKRFYGRMLSGGVYLAPSRFEANFLSFAHTQKEIEKTIDAARKGL